MPIKLQSELMTLRRMILTMAAGVEQRVRNAIRSLLQDDHDLAQTVRRGDREIDEMEVDIESECLRILALTAPVAGDLRFVLAVIRINNDLERVADMAKGIAKRVLDLHEKGYIEMPKALRDMASSAEQMLHDSVAALANEDAELCRRIRRSDQHVDDLLKEIFAWVQSEIPAHVERTAAAIDVLSIARKLERIADLATNIAEDVVFVIEGSVIRHTRA
jgi:phosphate transport system protein